ncbi:MAG: ABC transporter permease [Polyangiales bacterium]
MISAIRFTWLRLKRSKRLVGAAAAILLVVVLTTFGRYASPTALPVDTLFNTISNSVFGLLTYLVSLLLFPPIIAEEVERGTWALINTRAVGRIPLLISKFALTTAAAAALLCIGVLLLHIGMLATLPTAFVQQLVPVLRSNIALVLLVTAYGAIGTAWSVWFPKNAALGLGIYFVLIEWGLSLLTGTHRWLSLNAHARSLASFPTTELTDPNLHIDPTVSAVFLLLATIVAIGLACLGIQSRQYTRAENATE